ncbi:General substrate transporter [Conexivisphaera calida]|uniref:General substrate transporter n=1 Tax=Conexivisphaera calida TaxID=1874277 RepID=A0A4P2VBU7_9ARCH|nr:General substrate transporter [Conexivisphaera calida]
MLIASLSVAFMVYCARLVYGMVMPYMMQDLGLNHAQAGLIYSSYAAAYMIASPIVGFLVDVHDLRRVVLAFLPLVAAGTALMAAASSLWTAILSFGIAGAGASVGWTPLVTWVQRAYAGRRGTYLGALSVSTTAGIGILGLAMPWIIPRIGWRGVWGVLGLASAAWLIPAVWLARDFTSPPDAIPFSRYMGEFARVLRDGAFWLSGGSYMAATFAVITPLTFSADYARYLGAGAAWEGWIFAVIGFVSIAGMAIPALSDRVGRKRTLALNNIIMAAGLAGSALAGSIQSLAAWTAVVAVSYGGVWALYAALVRDMYGSRLAGGAMGAWVVMGSLGFLLSPPVDGFLIDVSGSYTSPYLLSAALALASIPLAFAARGRAMDAS